MNAWSSTIFTATAGMLRGRGVRAVSKEPQCAADARGTYVSQRLPGCCGGVGAGLSAKNLSVYARNKRWER